MFDTRDLQRLRHKAQIQSHHYVVGSPDHRKEQSDKFAFGESEVILPSDLQRTLNQPISKRRFVLVTHGFNTEKRVLDSLGVILSQSASSTRHNILYSSRIDTASKSS